MADIQSIPTTFFIDRKGVIQRLRSVTMSYNDLKRDALAADFSGEPRPATGGPIHSPRREPDAETIRPVVNQYSRRAGTVRGRLGETTESPACWLPPGQPFTCLI